jgi:hypothetical protein
MDELGYVGKIKGEKSAPTMAAGPVKPVSLALSSLPFVQHIIIP